MQSPRGPHPFSAARRPRAKNRARGLAAAAVVGLLGLALARDGARTAAGLVELAAIRIKDWHGHEQALTVADSGREALPARITATVAALKAGGAPAFRLSPGIEKDAFLSQRIAETAWPLPIDPAAPILVRTADEASSCTALAQNDGVAVDRCD